MYIFFLSFRWKGISLGELLIIKHGIEYRRYPTKSSLNPILTLRLLHLHSLVSSIGKTRRKYPTLLMLIVFAFYQTIEKPFLPKNVVKSHVNIYSWCVHLFI